MTFTPKAAILGLVFSFALSAQVDRVANGTEILVRTNESIDAKSPSDSRIYSAVVERDVMDNTGRVVIPRGANAELIMRDSSAEEIVLDLESVDVNGRRYVVSTDEEVVTTERNRNDGVGTNKRTGQYVGGGALIGSIIGAIAGGGKGAAIGAATGAGAGAVTQQTTRGGSVRIPSESLITFRLDRALRVGTDHDGYLQDGRHYHKYERRQERMERRQQQQQDRRY